MLNLPSHHCGRKNLQLTVRPGRQALHVHSLKPPRPCRWCEVYFHVKQRHNNHDWIGMPVPLFSVKALLLASRNIQSCLRANDNNNGVHHPQAD